jgi:hypothetical protein
MRSRTPRKLQIANCKLDIATADSGRPICNLQFEILNLQFIFLVALVALLLSAAPLLAAGSSAQPLQSFLRLKDQWPDLVGSSFRIEGHYTIAVKDYVKLKNCDLIFRSSKPLPKLSSGSKVVEISGRLAKDTDNGKLYFQIDQLKELPSDLVTFQQREASLSRGPPKDLYDLADWATTRGKFYDDKELLKRAKAAKLKGFSIERRDLKEVTAATLRGLAERARHLQLDEPLRFELLHESLWLEWESVRKAAEKSNTNPDDIDPAQDPPWRFLKQLDSELPGATTRSDDVKPLVANEYRRNPITSYRTASESNRRVMHRLFHMEVALAAIARLTKPDGSNGVDIADRLDQLVPEQHDQAEKLRDGELAFLAKNAGTLARTQLQELLQRCRDRQQDALAKEAIQGWLARRELSLRKSGVSGLIQLSDDRWSLLQEPIAAGEPLLEALPQTPNNVDVIERLKKLGFQEVNGRWTHPQQTPQANIAPATPMAEAEIDRNIRLGVPKIGMTPEELLRCLGAPSSITRIATSGRTTEMWIYREGAAVRHTMTLERRLNRRQAAVIAIQ